MAAGAKQAKSTMPQEAVAPDTSGRPRFHQSWQKLIRGEFVLGLHGYILFLSLNMRLLYETTLASENWKVPFIYV